MMQSSTSAKRALYSFMALLVATAIAFVILPKLSQPEPVVFDAADLALTENEDVVARGRYLSVAGNCTACHSAVGGEFMAGGVEFRTPFGTVFSTNITPDVETGIGAWTAEQFADSMRAGIRPSGEHLYPVFPYTSFTHLTDADLLALYAYFRSIPAVRGTPPENELPFPFNVRALLGVWKGLFFDAGTGLDTAVTAATESQATRGAYLVNALAHCGECHSPRNRLGAVRRDAFLSGGRYIDKVPGGAWKNWFAPNLTGADEGLSMWPEEEVVRYLQDGRNAFVETFGPMNEVIVHSTQHLREEDVRAMARYLKSLPPIVNDMEPPADSATLGMGRTIYNLHCGTCHLPTGLGDPEMAPRLAQASLVVRAHDPASLINVILYAPESAELPTPSTWREPMEEFQYLLTDEEVAALASFLRASWNNDAGRVTAEQVSAQR